MHTYFSKADTRRIFINFISQLLIFVVNLRFFLSLPPPQSFSIWIKVDTSSWFCWIKKKKPITFEVKVILELISLDLNFQVLYDVWLIHKSPSIWFFCKFFTDVCVQFSWQMFVFFKSFYWKSATCSFYLRVTCSLFHWYIEMANTHRFSDE